MSRIQNINLPVGPTPGWEIESDTGDSPGLKSIAQSFVILQSLKQSREKWLRSSFPKFSSRARGGKPADVVPPPHTMYNRGRCDLEIGPHKFLDTTIFEVHYHPVPASIPVPQSTTYTSSTWQAHNNGASYSTPKQQAETGTATTPSSSSAPPATSTPLLSSLTSVVTINAALIAQVNSAAISNPTLANLLQLAAAGKANGDQLKTLGLLIQSLAASPQAGQIQTAVTQETTQTSATSTPALPQNTTPAALKEFDLVIEFRESPSDRWIFPRGPTVCEYLPRHGNFASIGDIILSTIVPFSVTTAPVNDPSATDSINTPGPDSRQVIQFRFLKSSSVVWDSFCRWVGPIDKLEENRKILSSIKTPDRVFLAHQLAEGTKLTQVQNATAPIVPTKLIKPTSETYKPRRKTTSKKSTADGKAPPISPTKRKRQIQTKAVMPASKIACFACGQTDVPLIMGGRYCRPCAEAGRGTNSLPPAGINTTYRLPTASSEISTSSPAPMLNSANINPPIQASQSLTFVAHEPPSNPTQK
ncbi:hypothetical protein BJ138DRAFT_1154409 [Hygrophoropsis aurantiaca]|uniref:Uncharacterized protein n=1 Tax=Hygrophoropsis aurantiaca TaxID=72124 RepID=A0ACB8A9B0_9AGAM|nr:hypothetical protein BJ138DRAFT_1154409 [Hygrophoropsis aurantiaca]